MKEECIICKAPLIYLEKDEMMECVLCHKKELSKTRIDPMSYVKGMEMNGATYTYADDGEALAGTREAISVKSEVDYSKAGVYPVEYSYTAEGAPTAVTKLFVVVQDQEGTQDGK